MKRTISTALLLVALSATPSAAVPEFRIQYPNGIPRVQIVGDYRHSTYTVWRAGGPDGPFTLVTEADVLCVGPCFADDYSALPAHRYWYRFDVVDPEAGLLRFGPFQADISPDLARRLSANVSPNPGNGPTSVGLFLAGAPGSSIYTETALFDLQGRRLTTLHRGPLPSGPTRLTWNGRADDGRALPTGLYLLRVVTADGRHTVARVVRTR
jgi:flagellar hook capping protein FlgD